MQPKDNNTSKDILSPEEPKTKEPIIPENPTEPGINKKPAKRKLIILISVIVLVLAIILITLFIHHNTKTSTPQKSVKNPVTGKTTSPQSTTFQDSQAIFSKLGIKLIYIKDPTIYTGQTTTYCIHSAGSHKLCSTSIDYGAESNLTYDGKVVENIQKDIYNLALSQNGLHYAYNKISNDTAHIYIDSNMVNSFPAVKNTDLSDPKEYMSLDNLWVSNNGQDYVYLDSAGLHKDGKIIYSASPGQTIVGFPILSSDLNNYIVQQSYFPTPTSSSSSIVINGQIVASNINDGGNAEIGSGGVPLAFSENGAYSIYVVNNKVFVNNKPVTLPSGLDISSVKYLTVNNNGAYGLISGNTAYINGTSYNIAIPGWDKNDSGQSIQISQVGSTLHYLNWDYKTYNGANKIDLDGNSITLQKNTIYDLEFVGDTVYAFYGN
jgi:hypothetical protein